MSYGCRMFVSQMAVNTFCLSHGGVNSLFFCVCALWTIVCLFGPLLLAIVLSVLWFTTSDYHCVVCPLIYDFWLSLCCLSFDLRLLIIIVLSVLWFTTSDYHCVVCPLIYDFWLSLWCLSFDLRLLIIIVLSVLWFTTSDYHWASPNYTHNPNCFAQNIYNVLFIFPKMMLRNRNNT
jgi:hypothetical protein